MAYPLTSVFLAVSLMAAPATGQNTGSFVPTDKWSLDNSEGGCVTTQHFALSDDVLKLTVGATPLAAMVNVEIERQSPSDSKRTKGTATISTGSDTRSFTVPYETGFSADVIVDLKMKRDEVASLASATTFSVTLGDNENIVISPTLMPESLRESDACEAQLLASIGYTPSPTDSFATTSAAAINTNGGDWIHASDYPENMELGQFILGFIIGTDGRIHNCHTLALVPDPQLPDDLCAGLTKRGRFSPARDEKGNSVPSFWTRKIAVR